MNNTPSKKLIAHEYELRFFSKQKKGPLIKKRLLTSVYKLFQEKNLVKPTNIKRFSFLQNEYKVKDRKKKLRYRAYLKKENTKKFPCDHKIMLYKKELKNRFFYVPKGNKDFKYKFAYTEEYELINQTLKDIETVSYRERIECPVPFKKMVKTFCPEIKLGRTNYRDPILVLDNIKRTNYQADLLDQDKFMSVFSKVKSDYSIEFDISVGVKTKKTNFNDMLKQAKILAAVLDKILRETAN